MAGNADHDIGGSMSEEELHAPGSFLEDEVNLFDRWEIYLGVGGVPGHFLPLCPLKPLIFKN